MCVKAGRWCRDAPLSAGRRAERPDSRLSARTHAAPHGPDSLKSCSSPRTDARSPAETHADVLEEHKEELKQL